MFYSIYLTSGLYKARGRKLVANAPLVVGETVALCGTDIESSGWRRRPGGFLPRAALALGALAVQLLAQVGLRFRRRSSSPPAPGNG
jgi:hypothetical protein